MFVRLKPRKKEFEVWYDIAFIGDWGQMQTWLGPCDAVEKLLKMTGGKGLFIFKSYYFNNFLQKQEILYVWKKKRWKKLEDKVKKIQEFHCFYCGTSLPKLELGILTCSNCNVPLVPYIDKDMRQNFIKYSKTNEK